MAAKRYNTGKNRLSLVPTSLLEETAKVMTFGAEKYEPHNWKKGMSWSKVIDSLKRHLALFELGEDFDKESGLLHLAHLSCNTAFLIEYYTTHPELDDRDLWFKKPFKKVYLDIDGVLANFETAFMKHFNLDVNIPVTDWNDYRFKDNFDFLLNQEEFWLNIKPLIKAEELIYPISGYVTARIIPEEVTHKWLALHGFPKAKLINIWDKKKSEVLKELKCDVFIDDHIEHFVDCHSNNILCYLMTASHNEKYNVGFYRCNTINEFFNKIIN